MAVVGAPNFPRTHGTKRTLISIVLADDHQVVRDGLRALLSAEPDFQLIGEASDGLEAVQTVQDLVPDILVVDLMMPRLNGLEVVRQITHHKLRTRCLVLSMHSNESYVVEALRNGALGYVLKSSPGVELVKAIREVSAGRRYLSPPLSDKAVSLYASQLKEAGGDPYETLTKREREVFQLSAEGLSSAEVAKRLSLSHRTVEAHRANLMRKLRIRTRTDLIRYAIRRGLIPLED